MNELEQNNGHNPADTALEEVIKGAHVNVLDLKREDGILTRTNAQNTSLLHRVISAVTDNKDYRSELKVALFKNADEADDAVAAINECVTLGMDSTPIVDQIIARSAGQNHELLYKALETLTHSTFTTNYQGGKNASNRNKSNSPIA